MSNSECGLRTGVGFRTFRQIVGVKRRIHHVRRYFGRNRLPHQCRHSCDSIYLVFGMARAGQLLAFEESNHRRFLVSWPNHYAHCQKLLTDIDSLTSFRLDFEHGLLLYEEKPTPFSQFVSRA